MGMVLLRPDQAFLGAAFLTGAAFFRGALAAGDFAAAGLPDFFAAVCGRALP